LVRKVDNVTPVPPKVDIKTKPSEEQLAHILESTLRDDPENNDDVLTFSFFDCTSTYTFILMTSPIRMAVMFEIIKSMVASPGK